MSSRFERQSGIIGDEGQAILGRSHVTVVGCGGLGSMVVTDLVCAGVRNLRLIDGDTVTESNLNRQFVHAGSVGAPKVVSTRGWILRLDPGCSVEPVPRHLTDADADLVADTDIVVDCLDDPLSRLVLSRLCEGKGKVLVHAAVDAFHGQIAVIRPDGFLRMCHIYPHPSVGSSVPSFAPCVTAMGSLQAKAVIDVLLCSEDALRDEIVTFDLRDYSSTRHRLSAPH